MPQRPSRSLTYEYACFLEKEVEDYKESVPRSVLLSIGDDAVNALAGQQQFALTELVLCAEVDKIIVKRLRIPSYNTWRRNRITRDVSPSHPAIRYAQWRISSFRHRQRDRVGE